MVGTWASTGFHGQNDSVRLQAFTGKRNESEILDPNIRRQVYICNPVITRCFSRRRQT